MSDRKQEIAPCKTAGEMVEFLNELQENIIRIQNDPRDDSFNKVRDAKIYLLQCLLMEFTIALSNQEGKILNLPKITEIIKTQNNLYDIRAAQEVNCSSAVINEARFKIAVKNAFRTYKNIYYQGYLDPEQLISTHRKQGNIFERLYAYFFHTKSQSLLLKHGVFTPDNFTQKKDSDNNRYPKKT